MIAPNEVTVETREETDQPMSPGRRRSFENRSRTQVVFNGPPAWVFAEQQATARTSKPDGTPGQVTLSRPSAPVQSSV